MMSSEVNYCKYQYQLSGRFSGSCIVSKCCYVQLKKERCISSLTFPVFIHSFCFTECPNLESLLYILHIRLPSTIVTHMSKYTVLIVKTSENICSYINT